MGTTRRSRTSPTFRAQNIPSPISTNDDSDDDLQKNTSLDESFTEDGDLVDVKSSKMSGVVFATVVVAVICVIFAHFGGNTYVSKLMISRSVSARLASETASHALQISAKKQAHKQHNTPSTVITKTSSMSSGLIEFSVSGSDNHLERPTILYLSSSEDSESFKTAANQFGYVFGIPVTEQKYWDATSPVPTDPSSISNVLKSLKTICSNVPDSRPSCDMNSEKVYVAGATDFGFHAFKVDVMEEVWEEIRLPGLEGGSWEERLLWLQ
ncbi:hypothetical protein TL16_g01569 [Triparma laevis f. inornata]|uniref:Uncharacterized protein n=2 Tax=Triparma laevis TaxID=1534972 RepID=A0A9W7E5D7_9STRA|nr:hypothetical protein TL16_g01569 [Triparma laevis f. inornata]GMH68839.1 hypothetical protein TrLO_g1835 [Triparma laevis f. longispina]